MSTEGEVMDASGAPVTDELTGVHHGPQRDAIYEPEKTARRRASRAAPRRHRPAARRNITYVCTTSLNTAETVFGRRRRFGRLKSSQLDSREEKSSFTFCYLNMNDK